MKRVFDLFLSMVLLAGFIPLMSLVALAIYISDPGPVFFLQERVGRHGKLFSIIKFRTMYRSKEENTFQPGNRSRIFLTGKILRKTKLDELPQLLNVVKGEMSMVGPRPEVLKWTRVYPERWNMVLEVKPGITDNASIKFRHEEDLLAASDDPENLYREEILPGKLDLYETYVREHSFSGDLAIILRTIISIFKRAHR